VSYTPHTPEEIAHMLRTVQAESVDDLFASIPLPLRSVGALKLPPPESEQSLLRSFAQLAGQNESADRVPSFLGAGAYHHFIPSAVSALASRGEFLTAYTPYQAEVSQGTLQAIFEFQTVICQLTGLDIANASLYDGASATAEAVLLALRATRKRRVYVSQGLHPHYLEVLRTYTAQLDIELESLPLGSDGRTLVTDLREDTAAVLIQQPNFFGCIEELNTVSETTHAAGALLLTSTSEPLALALLKPPGAVGVDVACGEAQSFGVPLGFGGPYVGFMAARSKLVRQLPGRLVGETVDKDGRRAFVMTLTTREQHIRRERATSNICTNQGLCALRVVIYLALLGKHGLRHLARVNLSLAEFTKQQLREIGCEPVYTGPTFNEFALRVPELEQRLSKLAPNELHPGLRLDTYDAARRDQLLVCTTEMNSRADVAKLVEALRL